LGPGNIGKEQIMLEDGEDGETAENLD